MNISLEEAPKSCGVSPAKIYQITGSSSSFGACDSNDQCQLSHELINYRPKPCQLRVFCAKLKGHPCGNYGLATRIGENETEICHTGVFSSNELNQGDKVTLNLWYTKNATFDFSCYAWCTQDGHQEKQLGNVDKDLVLALLTTNTSIQNLGLSKLQDLVYLSSASIYHVKLSNNDFKDNSSLSKLSTQFKWLGEQRCLSRFICAKLSGNVCGDFSLTAQDEEVCRPGQVFKGEVNPNGIFTLDLWTLKLKEMEASCYLWCTFNGELPSEPSGSKLDPEAVSELVRVGWIH